MVRIMFRSARLAYNLTQARAASLLGVSRESVAAWEAGRRRPPAEAVERLTLAMALKPPAATAARLVTPGALELRAARIAAGMGAEAAGAMVGASGALWARWEGWRPPRRTHVTIPPAAWALWLAGGLPAGLEDPVPDAIRASRRAAGLTQAAAAACCWVTLRAWADYEQGRARVPLWVWGWWRAIRG